MTDFEKAMQFEAGEINIEDLMAEILGDYSAETNEKVVQTPEEQRLQIRRMIIALSYLNEEIQELKSMKKAVVDEWTKRVDAKEKQAASIKEYVTFWINEVNNKEKLQLDVATISSRRSAPSMYFDKELAEEAEKFFKEHNQFQHYTKEPELDHSKVLDAYNKMVEKEAETRIQEKLIMMQANGDKITKTKQTAIAKSITEEVLSEFASKLPAFLKVKDEHYTASIKMAKPTISTTEGE